MMQQRFLKSQESDGSWNARGGHSDAMGKTVGTAVTVLCLEAHYRYTPLYGLGFEPDPNGPLSEVKPQSELPETPLFRHAKYLEGFNSPVDDNAPVVTEHGDFLYFASERDGGFGGMDIYRARISGPDVAAVVENAGDAINSDKDEIDPALRNEGFQLLFNTNRDGTNGELFSAKSRRVEKRYDYAKLPGFGWIVRNILWVLVFTGAVTGCVIFTRRLLLERRRLAGNE